MKAVHSTLPAVNADVVRVLEDVLMDAKKGLITDIAVSYVKANGIVGNNFSYGVNKFAPLLGAIEVTKRDILDNLVSA